MIHESTYLGKRHANKRNHAHCTVNVTEVGARGPIVCVKGVHERRNRLTAQKRKGNKWHDAPNRGITQAYSLGVNIKNQVVSSCFGWLLVGF